MKQERTIGRIISCRYKSTSRDGNPSYWVKFQDSEGSVSVGYTATDASCGYGCENFINRMAEICHHTTKRGNIIIDYINKPN